MRSVLITRAAEHLDWISWVGDGVEHGTLLRLSYDWSARIPNSAQATSLPSRLRGTFSLRRNSIIELISTLKRRSAVRGED